MAKVPARGTTIKIGSTAVLQVSRIKPPNVTVETADVTELGDLHRVFRAAINDSGEVSFDIWFDPDESTMATVRDLIVNQVTNAQAVSITPQSWVITFADATPATCTFSAILTGFDVQELAIGGYASATITLKVTGALTWA